MNFSRESLIHDFPVTEESRVNVAGQALIIEPSEHAKLGELMQYCALELVIEELMHRKCTVVVHMQSERGENPSNYYTKRIKLETGKAKRVKLPVLSTLNWLEIFSAEGNVILRELNGLRLLSPFSEHEVLAPTNSTIVVPRGKAVFTPSGFEVTGNFLDSEAPIFASMLRPLDASSAYQLDVTVDAVCQFQNTDGLKDDFIGYWKQIFFVADFSPPTYVFWLNSRAERSGLLRCNTKLLATYEKPVVDLSRPNIWNVKTT